MRLRGEHRSEICIQKALQVEVGECPVRCLPSTCLEHSLKQPASTTGRAALMCSSWLAIIRYGTLIYGVDQRIFAM